MSAQPAVGLCLRHPARARLQLRRPRPPHARHSLITRCLAPIGGAADDQHHVSRRAALLAAGTASSLQLLSQPAFSAEPSRSRRSAPSSKQISTYLPRVPQVQIAPNIRLSKVIKGSWQLCGGHGGDPRTDRTEPPDAFQDQEVFCNAGITSIATSDAFGPAEAIVGQYLRLHPERKGQVQVVAEVHLASAMGTVTGEAVEYAVKAAALRMGVPRLDLVMLSWPEWEEGGCLEAAKYLADLQGKGLVGGVGLSNFDVAHMIPIVDAGVKVVCNQVTYSLIDRRPQLLMTEYCQRHGIHLLPYGVAAGGFLADKYLGVPAAQAKLDTLSKVKYGSVIGQAGGWDWFQDLLRAMKPVAQKHGASLSNVAARWVLQQPCVPAITLGARNAIHIQDHQRLFSFQLDQDDLVQLEVACETCPQPPTTDCHVWERGGAW